MTVTITDLFCGAGGSSLGAETAGGVGTGLMWTRHRPGRLVTADINPSRGDITADFRSLPFPDAAFGSVLFDPPYRLSGTRTNHGGFDDRYGTNDGYRSNDDTHRLITDGAVECARVVRRKGFLIVKCQAQVNGGRVRWQPRLVTNAVLERAAGTWELKDELFLFAVAGRPQPPRKCKSCRGDGWYSNTQDGGYRETCGICNGTGWVPMVQQHAARNYSTFLVFRRSG